MTLYELTTDYKQLLESGLDADDKQAFADTLEAVIGDIEVKADSYATVMAELEARKDDIDREVKRLNERKSALNNSIKRMKERLLEAMYAMGKREIVTALHTFRIQKNGGSRPLEITGDVPVAWQKITIETDTERIRAALENGMELPFAQLGERGEHVRIK